MVETSKPGPASARPEPELGAGAGFGLELFADLYELTMARAYRAIGFREEAVFSLFARRLPETRSFLIAAGLETVLRDLVGLRFGAASLDYLAGLDGRFPDDFLRWLEAFRFRGAVRALPEGTPIFANEPILEVRAPIAEAQLVETLLLNRFSLQTMLASKAARVVAAAEGRIVVDFGGRRAHGLDAAVTGARAMALAGVAGTANVLAGARFGLPVYGTVAHSFIDACGSEERAFVEFARLYPGATLLVDTYDTLRGVERVIELTRRLGPEFDVRGVRIDSGDLGRLAVESRARLDAAGLGHIKIFVSGGLDERQIAALLAAGAPIDGFGAGTDMSVSADAPSLDIVYKLVALGGEGRMKLSAGKRTPPGAKQVFRQTRDGVAIGDVIGRADEDLPGRPLLAPVMRNGEILAGAIPPFAAARAACAAALAELPEAVRVGLDPVEPGYPVAFSAALEADETALRAELAAREALRSGAPER